MLQKSFLITDEAGLHARPSTLIVQAASSFSSEIQLEFNGKKVNLKSIMGVMSLGVSKNSEVTVYTDGQDEEEALNKIEETLKSNQLIG